MPTYPTPQPVKLVVRIPSGRIEITTEDTQETTVNVRRLDGRDGGEDRTRRASSWTSVPRSARRDSSSSSPSAATSRGSVATRPTKS